MPFIHCSARDGQNLPAHLKSQSPGPFRNPERSWTFRTIQDLLGILKNPDTPGMFQESWTILNFQDHPGILKNPDTSGIFQESWTILTNPETPGILKNPEVLRTFQESWRILKNPETSGILKNPEEMPEIKLCVPVPKEGLNENELKKFSKAVVKLSKKE